MRIGEASSLTTSEKRRLSRLSPEDKLNTTPVYVISQEAFNQAFPNVARRNMEQTVNDSSSQTREQPPMLTTNGRRIQ